jgi:predicted ATPase
VARTGTNLGDPAFLGLLAEGCWRIGRHDDALEALGLGVARAQEQGQHYHDAELHRLRAEILLDRPVKRKSREDKWLQRDDEKT